MNHSDPRNSPMNPPGFRRLYEPDPKAMLAALRVVLGLPRIIPSSGQDDLLSEAT